MSLCRNCETREETINGVCDSCQTQADRLYYLVEASYVFGQTLSGDPYVVEKPGLSIVGSDLSATKPHPNVARPIRANGGELRPELALAYFLKYGLAPNPQSLSTALLIAQGQCLKAPKIEPALRFAVYEEGAVLDLGTVDGRTAVVTIDGWRMIERSPVLFRRTGLTGALPEPMRDGSLDALRPLLGVSDEDWPLLVACWIFNLLKPNASRVILRFVGEQGSAKSTRSRLIGRFIDPTEPPSRQVPATVEDWTMAAGGSYTVVLDNLTAIQDWLSDLMCRASTGEGYVQRARYSVDDLLVINFKRCIIYNGIAFAHMNNDLADRLVPFECERIEESARRTDEEIAAEFEAIWPSALGGLLNLAVLVLRELPNVQLASKPRMADFAVIVAAIDCVLGTSALATLLLRRDEIAGEAGEGDPVAVAISRVVQRVWEGTAAELLEEINKQTPKPRPQKWPESPRGMTAALTRVTPALRAWGIAVEQLPKSTGGRRGWKLMRTAETSRPYPTAEPPQPPPGAVSAAQGGYSASGGWVAVEGNRHPTATSPEPPSSQVSDVKRRSGGSGGLLQATGAPAEPEQDQARDLAALVAAEHCPKHGDQLVRS